MSTLRYTLEEMIESLKRTAINTVVVEGNDDIDIMRDIESRLSQIAGDVDFFPAGDKLSVLKIAESHDEFKKAKISYLADSDLWLFNDARANHPGVIFTEGYSIENICIQSPHVADLANARQKTEAVWKAALINLSEWFCAEVAYFLNGENPSFNIGVQQIVDFNNNCTLTPQARMRVEAAPQLPDELKDLVTQNPLLYIRGKQLFLALSEVMAIQEGNRIPVKTLKSLGAKLPNQTMDELVQKICESLT